MNPTLKRNPAAGDRQNLFAAPMDAVKAHSLAQISHTLYEEGGEYRRNMQWNLK